MKYNLAFEEHLVYDTGKPGISLDVWLGLGANSIAIEAKIDTGASNCIFERKYAEKLGFDVEAGVMQIFGTSTGSFPAYGHWVTLTTTTFSFDSLVFFAKDEAINRNVLGRHGWLDRVVVGINDYDGELYLRRFSNE